MTKGDTGGLPAVYSESVSAVSGAKYVPGGTNFTLQKAVRVVSVIAAEQVPVAGATCFVWKPAPGATGYGAGVTSGQVITLKAMAAGISGVSNGAFPEALSGTALSGATIQVTYLGG